MAHAPGSFCWFECATKKAATTKAFYSGLFGWDSTDVPMPGDAEGEYTLFKVGDGDVAGLYELAGPQFEGVPPHWMAYVMVASADASAERATSLGANVFLPPMDVPGVGRIACLTDPTGANIGMFQPREHRGSDTTVSNLGWCQLNTPDPAAAKAFYTELFDWGAKQDAHSPHTEFQLEGRSIGGMLPLEPEQQDVPPHWLLYAAIDDCDATLDKCNELGGQVIVPGQDIPHVGRFGVIADPAGAAIAVIKLVPHP